jgi:hypothetical protein
MLTKFILSHTIALGIFIYFDAISSAYNKLKGLHISCGLVGILFEKI